MKEFKYTPDQEIAIHRVGAIRHMCRPFLSHENGLPELVKNAAAAYLRESRRCEQRIIVLAFSDRTRSSPAKIACLDFVGMTSEQIERDFKQWADPEAATRSSRGEVSIGELGGHGNGGKCYMTQMFEDHSLLYTARNNRGCKYGVEGGSVAFGYVPNAHLGKDFQIVEVSDEIEKCLKSVRGSIAGLPEDAARVAQMAKGFTFVCGVKPKEWSGRKAIHNLLESLLVHHQMTTPLQVCRVYVIINGHPFNDGNHLSLPRIEPIQGFTEPRIIAVPEMLQDPISQQTVQTTDQGRSPAGKLEIHTSEKNMRLGRGGRRQWRHTVDFHTFQSGIIGRVPMLSLDVDSSYRDYLYCDCYLDALDPYQQNERRELAESALTRAVEKWIGGQVRAYCREFEERERQQIRKQDRDQLSRINEWLDQWKNRFMQELMQGLYGEGGEQPPRTDRSLPSGKPVLVQVACANSKAGVGVYFRPMIKFFDAHGRRIRPVPYRWFSEDNNVAMVDEELGLIQTFSVGHTKIYAVTLDGKLRSNEISLEVVRIHEIRVVPHEVSIPAGSRSRLEAVCTLATGETTSGVNLTWLEDNSSVARVSSSGMVYGVNQGQTKVTAVDESCRSDIQAAITVTPSEGTGEGTRRGRGYPMILISEISIAPDEEQPAVFRADEPPIMQRPRDVDNNIWWINLASPFARLYFADNRYGVQSEAWRMYHIERYVDIIVQIALTNGPDSEETFGSNEWIYRAGELEAEIRKKAIESLVPFIQSGEMR